MYLGIDIGTSGVKAVLIDDEGKSVDESVAPLDISRPHPLWSEQNPADWWSATNMAVAKLDLQQRHKIKAIGLSGQMHGATVLDEKDMPLRPAILWNDGRCHEEAQTLQEDTPEFLTVGGNLVMPGFTAPKLVWLQRHEPDVFRKIKTVLLPKDYVRLRMTGEHASDMSDSAGTLWMDVANRKWSDKLLAATGLSSDHMPTLYEGHEFTGKLRAEAAEAWGCERVPVVAGGGDNAAGAAGVGVINDGEALLSLGTSGVIFHATNQFRPFTDRAVHAFCHALPDRWHQMSVMLSAASCLDWVRKLMKAGETADLVALAEADGNIGAKEQFLPYLSGERTPHNNPHAMGTLFGLTFDSGVAQMGQAVMEGVAFGMAEGLEALVASGADVKTISVIGGGSKSLYWGRILAGATGRPLIYRDGAATGPAFGAARLARYGDQGGSLSDMFASPHVLEIVEPRDDDRSILGEKYEQFKSLYQRLEPEFTRRKV